MDTFNNVANSEIYVNMVLNCLFVNGTKLGYFHLSRSCDEHYKTANIKRFFGGRRV
jgi:hypothetical protein